MKIMANPLKTILELYVGTTITDPEDLSKIFQSSAIAEHTNNHCRSIFAPVAVYDLYWQSYEHAMKLADSIDAVMADGEHKLILEEAQSLGYTLPDMKAFKEEAAVYKHALEHLERGKGNRSRSDYVEVPINTARDLNDLMKKNCYMITRVFDECYNTDYLKHFTDCRKSGIKYAGPNALQPCVDLLISMARTLKELEKIAYKPIPNWDALISGNREDFLKPSL